MSKLTQKNNTRYKKRHKTRQQEIIEQGTRMNKQGDLFCYKDFDMSNDTFRQEIHKMRDKIETVIPSRPAYYKFKEIEVSGKKYDHITLEGMGVGKKLEEQLATVSKQFFAIHDIKLKFENNELYEKLLDSTGVLNEKNRGIFFPPVEVNDHMTVLFTVYPKTTTVEIGCTYKPIIYDPTGSLELVRILEKVATALELESGIKVTPTPLDWIITQYHYNQDGLQEYSGSGFNVTVKEFALGLVRCYVKSFPDGKKRIRREIIKTPKTTVREEIEKMKDINSNSKD